MAKDILLTTTLAILSIFMFFSLAITIKGPRRADRIMGINVVGSFSTAALCVLAVYLNEAWLLDVCLVYCLISFLAVVVLTKISIINKDKEEIDD